MLILVTCARREERQTPTAEAQSGSESVVAEVLARDHEYAEAWRRGDWPAIEAMIAPDYYVFDGAGGGIARLREEFPKIKLLEYKSEQPHVQILAPDLVLVNYVMQMRETYDGKDMSGRYWYSQIWIRREGRWLLLVEQELPMPSGVETAQ
jgi:ketosteroid isomerase-like protein